MFIGKNRSKLCDPKLDQYGSGWKNQNVDENLGNWKGLRRSRDVSLGKEWVLLF